jgi:signal transduction histidine kinase
VKLAGDAAEAFELDRPADRRDRPNTVSQILEDAAGTLWVGSGSGLQRFAGGRLVALTAADGLADTHVRCLCESPAGTLWVGTRNGLNRVAGGAVTRPDLGGAEADGVTALHAAGGAVWVGTKTGVLRVVDGQAVRIGRREGLPDDEVSTVVTDRTGGVWLGGPKALSRLDPDAVRRLLASEAATVSARRFGAADGMPHPGCSGGYFHPASLAALDGSVWVATDRGLTRATPGRLAKAFTPPPAAVEEVAIDGAEADLARPIRIPPGVRRLDVRFTALGPRSAEPTRFEYRLVGFDPDWVPAGTARTASYTNLPPGGYTFAVRAADESGEWGAAGEVRFRQEPAFHQTWWFAGLCGLGAVGLLAAAREGWVWAARSRQRLVKAERERVARELHDTVLQEVGVAAWTLDEVAADLPDAVARSAVADAARRVRLGLTDCRHAVWELRAVGLNDLAGALRAAAGELVGGSDVRLEFAAGDRRDLPPAVALALFRIGREAVANALRHAAPSVVRVALAHTRAGTTLTVTDDGSGFDPTAVAAGPLGAAVGLVGLWERAAAAGIALTVTSRVGEGCRVEAVYHAPGRLGGWFGRRFARPRPARVAADAR